MAFIHKNVNSALLMLIIFISTALVTATIYSVEAFDNIHTAYAEQTLRAEALAAELAEKEAMTASLQETARLTQEREKMLAEILQTQRQRAAQVESTGTEKTITTIPTTSASSRLSNEYVINKPKYVAGSYWNWVPRKTYVV